MNNSFHQDDPSQTAEQPPEANRLLEEQRAFRARMHRALKTSVGFLLSDLRWFLLYVSLSFAPVILLLAFDPYRPFSVLLVHGIRHALHLAILLHLGWRVFAPLRTASVPTSPEKALQEQELPTKQFFAYGFLIWGILMVPWGFARFAANTPFSIMSLAILPAAWIYLRYFFFPSPLLLGVKEHDEVIRQSTAYTAGKLMLGLYVIVGPKILVEFASSLITVFSPDHSSFFVRALNELFFAFEWPLRSYVWLAVSLLFLPNSLADRINKSEAEAYVETQVARADRTPWLANIFTIRNAGYLLLFLFAVQFANVARQITTPPSVQIEVLSATAHENKAVVTLRIEDVESDYRKFLPQQLSLRGATGLSIIKPGSKPEMRLNGSPYSQTDLYALQGKPATLELEFTSTRSGRSLSMLQDLHLWYFENKLASVVFESRDTTLPSEKGGSDSSAATTAEESFPKKQI